MFRFGVIGIGDVLRRILDAIHAHPGEVTLTALADILPPHVARRRLQELGLVGVPYFQVQSECQLPEEFWALCEAVYIASPNSTHKLYALAALARGKHVLVEKPLARTLEEAHEITEAAACSPARIYCTLHYAHFGISLILLWLIQSGQLQEFGLGQCVQVQGALLEADRRCDWRFAPEISGGDILIDLGGHPLSILYYATGAQIKVLDAAWDTVLNLWQEVEICGQQRKPATYFEVDFALEGELFAPGARGHIAVGKFIPQELAQKFLHLSFEQGKVILSFPDRLTVIASGGRPPLVLEEGRPGWPKDIWRLPYRNILESFLDHIRKDAATTRNLEIACLTLRDIFAAYKLCRRADFYNQAEALLAER